MIIDTHCHLDFSAFDGIRDEVIDRARHADVGAIINVASSLEGSYRSVALAKKHDCIFASVGIHPQQADLVTDTAIAEISALAKEEKVIAIGEVGLEYYGEVPSRDVQKEAFRKFIRLSEELKLPLIIHSREAHADLLDLLAEERKSPIDGVIHCFSGDPAFLDGCLDLGLHISFTGNLTYKNASLRREVAKHLPPERLLLETDAPYLAPQQVRGKQNEPAFLTYLVDEWASLLRLSREDIARVTTHNANRLFNLGILERSAIAYPIRDSLYLNITNRCTSSCTFCVRNSTAFVKGHNLKIKLEPSVDDILIAIGTDHSYGEIVFCGYGEPTLRLDVVKAVAAKMKEMSRRVRLVTNGHGDLIHKRPIARELVGIVDKVSVSLNADTAEAYQRLCVPEFGTGTYEAVIKFIGSCVEAGIETEATCLDMPQINVRGCEERIRALGAHFRLRHHGIVG